MSDTTWIPVVVVLPREALHELMALTSKRWDELEAADPKSSFTMESLLQRNGWTHYGMVGGLMLARCLRELAERQGNHQS